MLCDKITILKEGRVKISCKVNNLLSLIGGYIIMIRLKKKKFKNNKNKIIFHKNKQFLSFNENPQTNRLKSDSLKISNKGRDNQNLSSTRYRANTQQNNSGKSNLKREISFEKALEQLNSIKSGGKSSRNTDIKSHFIISNRGKYMIDSSDLITTIGKL